MTDQASYPEVNQKVLAALGKLPSKLLGYPVLDNTDEDVKLVHSAIQATLVVLEEHTTLTTSDAQGEPAFIEGLSAQYFDMVNS